ncbi:MAG: ornithine cyclodeaminase family protein [Pseudomonadota bacterium]
MTSKPIIIDHAAVVEALSQLDPVQAMRELFTAFGNARAVQPPQTITEFPSGGDFITYLGAIEGERVFGAKLSPYLPRKTDPIITAWTVLMSMEDGQPLALVDAGVLTRQRTAATTALAVDLLARKDKPLNLAIIGAGAVAQAHMQLVDNLREWASVKVYSPSLAKNETKQSAWRAIIPDFEAPATAKDAISRADVIMLCTSSGSPVIQTADVKSSALVTSISTNVPKAHEVDPAFLSYAQVFCDYRETTPDSAGDMLLAAELHGWDKDQVVGDLAELCTNTLPDLKENHPVYFRSIGLGLEDVAIANAIYNRIAG